MSFEGTALRMRWALFWVDHCSMPKSCTFPVIRWRHTVCRMTFCSRLGKSSGTWNRSIPLPTYMTWTSICGKSSWTWRKTSWLDSIRILPTLGARVSITWNTAFHRSDIEVSCTAGLGTFTPGCDGIGIPSACSDSLQGCSKTLDSSGSWLSGIGLFEGSESRSITCWVLNLLLGLKLNRVRLVGGSSSCSPTRASEKEKQIIHSATFLAKPEQYVAQKRVSGMRRPLAETLPSMDWCMCLWSHLAFDNCWTNFQLVENRWLDFRRNRLVWGCFNPNIHMSKLARLVILWIGWNCLSCGIVDPFGCSRWNSRFLCFWKEHRAAHRSTCFSSCCCHEQMRSNRVTLLNMLSLLQPPQGPHSGATHMLSGWYLSISCHNFRWPSVVDRSPSCLVKRKAKWPMAWAAFVSGLLGSAYISSRTHCRWGTLQAGDMNASWRIWFTWYMDFSSSSLNNWGPSQWCKLCWVCFTSAWKVLWRSIPGQIDPKHSDPSPSALDSTLQSLGSRASGCWSGPVPIGHILDPFAEPEHMFGRGVSCPTWSGIETSLRLSSEWRLLEPTHPGCWWFPSERHSGPHVALLLPVRFDGPPSPWSLPPPPAPPSLTLGSSQLWWLQRHSVLLVVEYFEPPSLTSLANCRHLEVLSTPLVVSAQLESLEILRLLLNFQLNLGRHDSGLFGTWGFAAWHAGFAALGPSLPSFASSLEDCLNPRAWTPADESKTAEAWWEGWSLPRPRSSRSSSLAPLAWWMSLVGTSDAGTAESFETVLAMVREILSICFWSSWNPYVGSQPLDRTSQSWWSGENGLKKLVEGAHSWRTSNKYNSVGFSSKWIFRSSLWR